MPSSVSSSGSSSSSTHFRATVPANLAPLKPLIRGAREQRELMQANPELAEKYRKLAEGQAPDYMVISCSDSRYTPTEVFNMTPGTIFNQKHVGAIVARHDLPFVMRDTLSMATIRYAVTVLKVKHILILAHTHCGAVGGILQGAKYANMCSHAMAKLPLGLRADGGGHAGATGPLQRALAAAGTWVSGAGTSAGELGRKAVAWSDWGLRAGLAAAQGHNTELDNAFVLAGPVVERVEAHYGTLSAEQRQFAASAETALLQREHLMAYPVVKEAMAAGTLEDVHAMVLEIDTRVVNAFDESVGYFVPLNAEESGLPRRRSV